MYSTHILFMNFEKDLTVVYGKHVSFYGRSQLVWLMYTLCKRPDIIWKT